MEESEPKGSSRGLVLCKAVSFDEHVDLMRLRPEQVEAIENERRSFRTLRIAVGPSRRDIRNGAVENEIVWDFRCGRCVCIGL